MAQNINYLQNIKQIDDIDILEIDKREIYRFIQNDDDIIFRVTSKEDKIKDSIHENFPYQYKIFASTCFLGYGYAHMLWVAIDMGGTILMFDISTFPNIGIAGIFTFQYFLNHIEYHRRPDNDDDDDDKPERGIAPNDVGFHGIFEEEDGKVYKLIDGYTLEYTDDKLSNITVVKREDYNKL